VRELVMMRGKNPKTVGLMNEFVKKNEGMKPKIPFGKTL
jgi:hypothetical protein